MTVSGGSYKNEEEKTQNKGKKKMEYNPQQSDERTRSHDCLHKRSMRVHKKIDYTYKTNATKETESRNKKVLSSKNKKSSECDTLTKRANNKTKKSPSNRLKKAQKHAEEASVSLVINKECPVETSVIDTPLNNTNSNIKATSKAQSKSTVKLTDHQEIHKTTGFDREAQKLPNGMKPSQNFAERNGDLRLNKEMSSISNLHPPVMSPGSNKKNASGESIFLKTNQICVEKCQKEYGGNDTELTKSDGAGVSISPQKEEGSLYIKNIIHLLKKPDENNTGKEDGNNDVINISKDISIGKSEEKTIKKSDHNFSYIKRLRRQALLQMEKNLQKKMNILKRELMKEETFASSEIIDLTNDDDCMIGLSDTKESLLPSLSCGSRNDLVESLNTNNISNDNNHDIKTEGNINVLESDLNVIEISSSSSSDEEGNNIFRNSQRKSLPIRDDEVPFDFCCSSDRVEDLKPNLLSSGKTILIANVDAENLTPPDYSPDIEVLDRKYVTNSTPENFNPMIEISDFIKCQDLNLSQLSLNALTSKTMVEECKESNLTPECLDTLKASSERSDIFLKQKPPLLENNETDNGTLDNCSDRIKNKLKSKFMTKQKITITERVRSKRTASSRSTFVKKNGDLSNSVREKLINYKGVKSCDSEGTSLNLRRASIKASEESKKDKGKMKRITSSEPTGDCTTFPIDAKFIGTQATEKLKSIKDCISCTSEFPESSDNCKEPSKSYPNTKKSLLNKDKNFEKVTNHPKKKVTKLSNIIENDINSKFIDNTEAVRQPMISKDINHFETDINKCRVKGKSSSFNKATPKKSTEKIGKDRIGHARKGNLDCESSIKNNMKAAVISDLKQTVGSIRSKKKAKNNNEITGNEESLNIEKKKLAKDNVKNVEPAAKSYCGESLSFKKEVQNGSDGFCIEIPSGSKRSKKKKIYSGKGEEKDTPCEIEMEKSKLAILRGQIRECSVAILPKDNVNLNDNLLKNSGQMKLGSGPSIIGSSCDILNTDESNESNDINKSICGDPCDTKKSNPEFKKKNSVHRRVSVSQDKKQPSELSNEKRKMYEELHCTKRDTSETYKLKSDCSKKFPDGSNSGKKINTKIQNDKKRKSSNSSEGLSSNKQKEECSRSDCDLKDKEKYSKKEKSSNKTSKEAFNVSRQSTYDTEKCESAKRLCKKYIENNIAFNVKSSQSEDASTTSCKMKCEDSSDKSRKSNIESNRTDCDKLRSNPSPNRAIMEVSCSDRTMKLSDAEMSIQKQSCVCPTFDAALSSDPQASVNDSEITDGQSSIVFSGVSKISLEVVRQNPAEPNTSCLLSSDPVQDIMTTNNKTDNMQVSNTNDNSPKSRVIEKSKYIGQRSNEATAQRVVSVGDMNCKQSTFKRNIGFRMETVYADGIRMFGFSPKLNKFSGSFSSADSNEKICFTSVDYSSKNHYLDNYKSTEHYKKLTDEHQKDCENLTDTEKFFLPYCPDLLRFSVCNKNDACLFAHKFDPEKLRKNGFSDVWSHVVKLFNGSRGYMISVDFVESVTKWLGSQGKRNKLLEPALYIASLDSLKISADYLNTCWSSLLDAYNQTGVSRVSAAQNILHHITSHKPSLSIQAIQQIIYYLGLLSSDIEEVWPTVQVLKKIPNFSYPTEFFESMMLNTLNKRKIPSNQFKSVLMEFTEEFLKLEVKCLLKMNLDIIDKFSYNLSSFNLHNYDIKIQNLLNKLSKEDDIKGKNLGLTPSIGLSSNPGDSEEIILPKNLSPTLKNVYPSDSTTKFNSPNDQVEKSVESSSESYMTSESLNDDTISKAPKQSLIGSRKRRSSYFTSSAGSLCSSSLNKIQKQNPIKVWENEHDIITKNGYTCGLPWNSNEANFHSFNHYPGVKSDHLHGSNSNKNNTDFKSNTNCHNAISIWDKSIVPSVRRPLIEPWETPVSNSSQLLINHIANFPFDQGRTSYSLTTKYQENNRPYYYPKMEYRHQPYKRNRQNNIPQDSSRHIKHKCRTRCSLSSDTEDLQKEAKENKYSHQNSPSYRNVIIDRTANVSQYEVSHQNAPGIIGPSLSKDGKCNEIRENVNLSVPWEKEDPSNSDFSSNILQKINRAQTPEKSLQQDKFDSIISTGGPNILNESSSKPKQADVCQQMPKIDSYSTVCKDSVEKMYGSSSLKNKSTVENKYSHPESNRREGRKDYKKNLSPLKRKIFVQKEQSMSQITFSQDSDGLIGCGYPSEDMDFSDFNLANANAKFHSESNVEKMPDEHLNNGTSEELAQSFKMYENHSQINKNMKCDSQSGPSKFDGMASSPRISKMLSLPFPRGSVVNEQVKLDENFDHSTSLENSMSPSSSGSDKSVYNELLCKSDIHTPSSLDKSKEPSAIKTDRNVNETCVRVKMNITIPPRTLNEIKLSMVQLLREREIPEIFVVLCEWSNNRNVMDSLSFSILDALKSIEATEIYVIMKNFFLLLGDYQKSSLDNERKDGKEEERRYNLYSVFGTIGTSIMLQFIANGCWKNALDMYTLLQKSGYSKTIDERYTRPEENYSQVCVAIAVCEVFMNTSRYQEAVGIILDNKLLMEKDLWVLVGNDDDVDIVRQMSHLLLEIMCKDMVSTELTMFFLEEVIESQKSLRSPINVIQVIEEIMGAFHDTNPDKKNMWLIKFYEYLRNFDELDDLNMLSYRVLLINFIRTKHWRMEEILAYCVRRGLYPQLNGQESVLQIQSNWQKEEIWIVLDKWFERIAANLSDGIQRNDAHFIIEYKMSDPIQEGSEKRPKRLININQDIDEVHGRFFYALNAYNPPLVYLSMDLDRRTVTLHPAKCRQIIERKYSSTKNHVQ